MPASRQWADAVAIVVALVVLGAVLGAACGPFWIPSTAKLYPWPVPQLQCSDCGLGLGLLAGLPIALVVGIGRDPDRRR